MESFKLNERGKYRKFSLSHRLQQLEENFKASGGKFKNYKISDLFNIYSPAKRFNANAVKFGGKFPYVVRTSKNNGIRDYITEDEKYLSPANTFSFGQDTATVFYQDKPYFTGDKIKVMRLKVGILNKERACYLLSVIRKAFSNFSWGQNSFDENVLNNVEIVVPTKNNQIDFYYMEERIHVLEMERVHVLENHLHVSGLDFYSLTSEESTVLNNLRSGNVVFKQYKIGNLFDIEGIRQAKSQSAIPNDDKGIPYVVQSQFNNMVSRFVNEKYLCNNNEPVCEGNAIVLGVTLAAVSYQDRKFGASQVITARAKFLNENIGNYFVALLRKLMVQFSYQNKPGIKIYKEMMVSLPTNENNQPDFAFMETYIQAIKKKVIKNVVDWKDKEIEKTKNVVSCVS